MDFVIPHDATGHDLTVDTVVTGDGRLVRLYLIGELDELNTTQLLAALSAVLERPGCERIELNLRGISFLDSRGIRCLLQCLNLADAGGRCLTVTEPAARVVRLLKLTGLSSLFGLAGEDLPERPHSAV